MRLFRGTIVAFAAVAATLSMWSAASAENILAAATRTANDNATTTGVFKALNDAGSTSISFTTSATSTLVKVTYNAECSAIGSAGSWVAVTLFIDNHEMNPKNNTDFAMCTANGTSVFDWTGAVRQSVLVVRAGTHHVRVRVDLVAGATTWWLGDTSLVVEGQ